MKTNLKYIFVTGLVIFGLVSCSFPFGQSTVVDENAVNTSVAQTLVALGGGGTFNRCVNAGSNFADHHERSIANCSFAHGCPDGSSAHAHAHKRHMQPGEMD